MSTLKKISVGAVFALVIIDIIGAILKQSAVLCALEMDDEYLVCGDMATIWTIVEPAIAVVVCALPAYRALLPSSRKRRGQEMLQQPHAANKAAKALKLNPIPDFDKEMNLLREPELAQLVQLHHSQEDQNRSPQSQASYSDLMV
ncbi:hypothetical protein MMC10_007110 [Thelotrema lepadinum]|nr:hypothetical protein [Thelotrema lepadinum]